MKDRNIFVCTECGYEASKWLGKCPDCGQWNTFTEQKKAKFETTKPIISNNNPTVMTEIKGDEYARVTTNISEFDRILGGGMVVGSVVLLGGAPGIGKSTLLLSFAAKCGKKVLYVSGEESLSQIKMRSDRISSATENIFLLSTNNILDVEAGIEKIEPEILIIDSVQTIADTDLQASSGSIAQVREVAARMLAIAKSRGIIVFLIGHVTKEGMLAGPKVLEHIVDTVLYFEDENGLYRIIRCFKNRFGASSEIAVFEMTNKGLEEVDTPEKLFYSSDSIDIPGTVITSVVEGTRPVIVEIQALVSRTNYGMARRQSTGFDFNRLVFLIAVIEKKLGINFATQDIFVNVVGGLKVKEPSVDLAIIAAILSSYYDVAVSRDTMFLGEVGLGGEVRNVTFIKERLSRATKLGISTCITSSVDNYAPKNIKLIKLKFVNEIMKFIGKDKNSCSR